MPESDRPRISNLARHPTERREGRGRFDVIAGAVSNFASSGIFFGFCFLILGIWAAGLVFDFAGGTENALTGSMTALTLLLVALLKNSEMRAERAMQLKLDAIAGALLDDRAGELPAEAKAELEEAVGLHEEL
jgi:low affinity Fe/Cu permease